MSWVNQFEGLKRLDPSLLETLTTSSEVASFKKGTVIFGQGKAPEHLVLLLDGRIQVQQVSEGGREIVLYRVDAGNSCVLTTACVLAYEDNSANAIAETDITAVLIPRQTFDELLGASREFRYFVLSAFTKRLTDLFQVIEEVAFKRIDHRLAQKLIDLSQDSPLINTWLLNLEVYVKSSLVRWPNFRVTAGFCRVAALSKLSIAENCRIW